MWIHLIKWRFLWRCRRGCFRSLVCFEYCLVYCTVFATLEICYYLITLLLVTVVTKFVSSVTHACILALQVAVENQVRTLRHRWELVKRGNLLSFLAAPAGVEMTPQLESSVSEMTRSLKSLFSVLFCTSRGEPSISQQLLVTISQIKEMLQTRLADCEDYLLVKGQRNVTMTAYPFHGLQRSFYHVKSLHNPCTVCAKDRVFAHDIIGCFYTRDA